MVNGVQEPNSLPTHVHFDRQRTPIPTQMPMAPSEYPEYLDNRVYQGMSGAIYPLPFHERISQEAELREWDLITLSNEWVEIAMLPELGGRIAWGIDKTREYDMFYKNQVIKPALVGLAGPWISGGIEFNWPQHHRPATFLPTTPEIEHEEDGAITVWFSDHDPFARMKGMHGVRLRPDSALIELRVRLHNRTDDTQVFLWWANVAARASDHYQAFFPTDVHFVADHARRAITAFPKADRPYYGWDYPAAAKAQPGADDIQWYKNIPVPTSYMCIGTQDEFFGGYDHQHRAGFVHVADHHISPGKKLWTWGNAEFGWAWDRNLTEVDGPYVELMAGVYTDNQPDFAFLQPGETKSFSQFWYPYQELGPVQQANVDAAIALDVDDARASVGVAVTRDYPELSIQLSIGGTPFWTTQADVGPGRPFRGDVDLPAGVAPHELTVAVSANDVELLSWGPRLEPDTPVEPEPASEPPPPEDIDSVDELYITGLHLMQYQHSTRRPEPYWQEAAKRDPSDSRCRTALGVSCLRRGLLDQAEEHLRAAIRRATRRNPNPAQTEAYYRLGQVLERSRRHDEALEAYGRAGWTLEWRDAASLAMARILAAAGRNREGLLRVAGSGSRRDLRNRDRCVEVILLRRLGRQDEAEAVLSQVRAADLLDAWAADLAGAAMPPDAGTHLDVALEYSSVGDVDRALEILEGLRTLPVPLGQVNVVPLAHLHRASLLVDRGDMELARQALGEAELAESRWCFPSRPQDLDMLVRMSEQFDDSALVHRLMGHLLYHLRRREEALEAWARAVDIQDDDPVTRRNLAVGTYNSAGDFETALAHYDRARQLAPTHSKLLYEQDQLRKRAGESPEERLLHLSASRTLVAERDDLTVEYVEVLHATGGAEEALDIMRSRRFQPWEGGEGRVLSAWEEILLDLARQDLDDDKPHEAEQKLVSALRPPDSLGEARHPLANYSHLLLALGDALAAQGRTAEAEEAWRRAATFVGDFRTMSTVPFSDMTYFSVLASRRLGDGSRARALVDGLERYADQLDDTTPKVDFFATSLPSLLLFKEDLQKRQDIQVAILRGQISALRGDREEASKLWEQALQMDPNAVRPFQLSQDLVRDF